jgi:DNA-binding transcriptional regulator LsrR (DeoR family)
MDRLVLIPIPSLLDNESIRDALLRDSGVRRAMALLDGCTVALVGVGAIETIASPTEAPSSPVESGHGASEGRPWQRQRRQVVPVSEDEVAELRSVGAVGEICTRFFDVRGEPCRTALDRRMVGLDLDQLRAVPLVIGVACGRPKAAAILGAVRGGYVKSLVTDEVTATAVLALARSTPNGVPDATTSVDDGGDGSAGHESSGRPGCRSRPVR